MVSSVRDSEVCYSFVGPSYSWRSRCRCTNFVFNLRDKRIIFSCQRRVMLSKHNITLPRVITLPSIIDQTIVRCWFTNTPSAEGVLNRLSLLLHCPLFKSLASHQQCYGHLAMSKPLGRNYAIRRVKKKFASSWHRTLLGPACRAEEKLKFFFS